MREKTDLYTHLLIITGTLALGLIVALGAAPAVLLFVVLAILIAVAGSLSTLKYFGILTPLYVETVSTVQTNQKLLLTDSRHRFIETIFLAIKALPLSVNDKQTLYTFTVQTDKTLSALMKSERVPVSLSNVYFGALTVTFRLRLREFSRANLEKLMKLDALLVQALAVESVRLIQGAGYVDCEISSPIHVRVDALALLKYTHNTTVAIGLDTRLKPVVVDISQHGLIVAVAPSRRGKTQALRTMLYLLKRQNPNVNIVVVAFKRADWQAFDHCASIIFDTQEIQQFQAWLLASMYEKAKKQDYQRWVVVFDDLVNLLATNPELQESITQFASLGAGVGVTTIVSTQFSGKAAGGVATFANATARLIFKPSSNLQGARDGGFAGLGLDQLSSAKGDALLVVDGYATRITTALTSDTNIESLVGNKPEREWLECQSSRLSMGQNSTLSKLTVHPMEQYIETLDGWLLDDGVFDWNTGKFSNRSEALRRLGWSANGFYRNKLSEFEDYIYQHGAHLQ